MCIMEIFYHCHLLIYIYKYAIIKPIKLFVPVACFIFFLIFQEYSIQYSIFQSLNILVALFFLGTFWNIPYSIFFKIFVLEDFSCNIPYSTNNDCSALTSPKLVSWGLVLRPKKNRFVSSTKNSFRWQTQKLVLWAVPKNSFHKHSFS